MQGIINFEFITAQHVVFQLFLKQASSVISRNPKDKEFLVFAWALLIVTEREEMSLNSNKGLQWFLGTGCLGIPPNFFLAY
jgi:hypothetical protein